MIWSNMMRGRFWFPHTMASQADKIGAENRHTKQRKQCTRQRPDGAFAKEPVAEKDTQGSHEGDGDLQDVHGPVLKQSISHHIWGKRIN
jgi:hypothetical protein